MRNEQRKVITTFARCLCGLATAWTATSAAAAAVDSYRIGQLYSNQSGYSQFIELVEVAGQDGQDQLTGLTLKVTNRAGVVKTFVFTHDLPNPNTANRHVTIASQGLAYDLQFPECTSPCPAFGVTVDYVMPDLFLPTDGARSIAVTFAPARASASLSRPPPQPTSSARAPLRFARPAM